MLVNTVCCVSLVRSLRKRPHTSLTSSGVWWSRVCRASSSACLWRNRRCCCSSSITASTVWFVHMHLTSWTVISRHPLRSVPHYLLCFSSLGGTVALPNRLYMVFNCALNSKYQPRGSSSAHGCFHLFLACADLRRGVSHPVRWHICIVKWFHCLVFVCWSCVLWWRL